MRRIIPECIIDANVIFDAETGDILPEVFHLEYRFITTHFVISEIESIPHSKLTALGLIIQDMPGELVGMMLAAKEKQIELSIADISVLVMAKHTDAIVLSGDGPLRSAAKKAEITYHGTLWLMDKLVEREIINPHRAAEALQSMCDSERWLPEEECRWRMRVWGSEKGKNK